MSTTAPRAAGPVLGEPLAGRLRACAREVADALRDGAAPTGEPTLDGLAGRAILFAYAAEAWPGAGFDGAALDALGRAAEGLASASLGPGLFGGFTGVAWAIEHLAPRLGLDAAEATAEVDEVLDELLSGSPWTGPFDLAGGLAGLAIYTLEQLPRPGAARRLARVVERLAELAERRPDGITWRLRGGGLPGVGRAAQPEEWADVGVAHGVPGVVYALAGACAAGVERDRVRPLLDGAARWILAQRGGASRSELPPQVGPGLAWSRARAAWCYGNPGVAASLVAAAEAARMPWLEEEAVALARHAATWSDESCQVEDAGLCHGASGLGLLYQRLWDATGDERLAEAARHWYARALAMRQPGRGVAGFSFLLPDGRGGFASRDDGSLLYGACGAALAFLAAVDDRAPAWTRLLGLWYPPSLEPTGAS